MSYIYKIHHLPTSDPVLLSFLAGKFAALRLSALTVSAAAFSSTFANESAFTAQGWVKRLERPLVHNFIAVAYAPSTLPEQQTIDAGDWVGSATLLGLFPKDVFELPESRGAEIGGDDVESKWQMTAVYNNPDHRGKGIAKMLIQGAMDFAANGGGKGKRSRMRIMIHPDNIAVKRLYQGLGFVDAGNCTLAEAYRSNGDATMLPADGGVSNPERYHNRRGIIMECVSSVA
jgi:ribosomal protein S18 acetylase RimI-like enzyme